MNNKIRMQILDELKQIMNDLLALKCTNCGSDALDSDSSPGVALIDMLAALTERISCL
jgi:hypothetical protein